jgi:hypothetical protein
MPRPSPRLEERTMARLPERPRSMEDSEVKGAAWAVAVGL